MKTKGRIRSSKPASVIAAIVGVGFVLLGFIVFVPEFGIFGWIWALTALSITGFHLFNLFTTEGVAEHEFDISSPNSGLSVRAEGFSIEERLKTLDELRRKGLVDEKEYEHQRLLILSGL